MEGPEGPDTLGPKAPEFSVSDGVTGVSTGMTSEVYNSRQSAGPPLYTSEPLTCGFRSDVYTPRVVYGGRNEGVYTPCLCWSGDDSRSGLLHT